MNVDVENTPTLQRCTKKACGPCHVGFILKDNMHRILKLFDTDLEEYSMSMEVTKCLNTAVVMMFLYLGDVALNHTRFCNVNNVRERYKGLITTHGALAYKANVTAVKELAKRMLNLNVRYRYLHYIMITNATVDGKTFPGHVFVIEKIPAQTRDGVPMFYMYQSYINEYDLKGYVERNASSFSIPYEQMQAFLKEMEYMMSRETWDKRIIDFWSKLTFTDSNYLEHFPIRDTILFCYRQVKVTNCINVLKQKTLEKLKKVDDSALREDAKQVLDSLKTYALQQSQSEKHIEK